MTPSDLAPIEQAGIPFEVRKPESAPPPGAVEGERDIAVAARDAKRLQGVLVAEGWHPVHSLDARHHFYVKVRDGRWTKLDVKLRGGRRFSLPLSIRHRGPLVALLGPDGAGKSTIAAEMARRIPLGVRVAYLGSGGGGGAKSTGPRPPRSALRQTAGVLKDAARSAMALAREWWATTRGSIVLCDRHPVELLAVRPVRHPVAAKLERFLARRVFPSPDALVVLEAPVHVLLARKPEHPAERLKEWAAAYREEFFLRGATFVDTSGELEDALDATSEAVLAALAARAER